jgi:outer membrane protein assembly factor BamB
MGPLTADDPQAIGGFRLQARLGAGAMGRVYLATSPAGRMVAVKVLQPELASDQEFIRRFRAEADAARLVSGIYTAPVVEAGVDDVPPWLATAFVPGPSLDDVISRFGPLPVAALWRLAAGLAEALRAIHTVGLVHRDLKPGNVLLAYDGPRVIDFGIARAVAEGRLTTTGPVVGTMGYLSPEQAQGHVAGPPSDVFSLGCVLAFAATGASPFSVGTDALPAAVVYRVVQEDPDLGQVPVQLRQLIQDCLAKDPSLRPDPGHIAAQCAAAAEQVRLSPASFWPSDLADLIGAQQAALTAELRVLPVPAPLSHADPVATQYAAPPAPPGFPRPASTYPARPSSGDTSRRGFLIGAGVVAAVAGVGAGAWALTSHSAQPPAKAGGGTARKGPGTLAWTFRASHGVSANPAVANGVVYLGSAAGTLFAADAATGRELWSLPIDSVTAAPTVTGGIVCVSAAQGDFYAVHAATGTLAWDLSGNQLAPFARNWAASGAHVAVAIGDQTVRMYKAAGGKSLWIATTSDESGFGQVVAAAGGAVYAVGVRGALYGLQAATGHEVYRVQVLRGGDSPATNLVMSGGTLYLGAKSGPLYALNPASGKLKWAARPGNGFPAADPVIADGMVYFTDSDAVLQAVDASTGKGKWEHHTGGKPTGGPAVAGGFVYVCGGAGLQQLHAKTGKPRWTYTAPSGAAFSATPAVASGLVLAGCADGSLYAIRA